MVNKEQVINNILTEMSHSLNGTQLLQLQSVLTSNFESIGFSDEKQLPSTQLIDNQNIIDTFLAVKKTEGLSAKSLKTYQNCLMQFDLNINRNFLDVDTNAIRAYLLMRGRDLSNASVDNNRRVINTMYEWLVDDGYITINPCKKVKKVKVEKKVNNALSDSEVVKIRDACRNDRDIAIVDLMLSTGCRVEELTKIKLSEINFTENQILIHGKGAKERIVFMDERCSQHLKNYINGRSYSSAYLFCKTRGNNHSKLTPDYMERLVVGIGRHAGVDRSTVHRFRKHFATVLFQRGCPLETIKTLMGHEAVETTLIYINSNNNIIKKDYQKYMAA